MSRWRGSLFGESFLRGPPSRRPPLRWLPPPFGIGRDDGIPASLRLLAEFRHGRIVDGNRLIFGLRPRGRLIGMDEIQTHALNAALAITKSGGSAVRQIDDPARDDRSPVIDADHDGPAIAQVGDPDIASKGKRQVGGRHVVHVIRLAAGGRLSIKILAIPRSCTNLIRFGLTGLCADFGFAMGFTTSCWCRPRVVRSLSRSQAGYD